MKSIMVGLSIFLISSTFFQAYSQNEEDFFHRKSPNDMPRDSVTKFVYTSNLQINPTYIGGDNKLDSFLKKNLDPSIPLQNGAPKGTYYLVISFVIRKNGTLSNFGMGGGGAHIMYKYSITSFQNASPLLTDDNEVGEKIGNQLFKNLSDLNSDYGLATEAIRVLKLAGKWKPGTAHGENVDSYWKTGIFFTVK